ncbi:hypothetical protein CRG98_049731, partial [Punica granatum]
GLRVPGLRVRINRFRDFASPDFASAFTALGTSRPRTSRPLYRFPDFASTFTAFRTSRPRTSRPFYCFLRASALHPPLHIPQIPLTILSHDRGGELPQRTTIEATAGTKRVPLMIFGYIL